MGLIYRLLLYFIFITAVYVSSSLILRAVLYLIYTGILPVPFLSPVYALGIRGLS